MARSEAAGRAVTASTLGSRFGAGLACVAISLLLHAGLAIRMLGLNRSRPAPPPREQLVVELVGMLSNRQLEQKQLGKTDAPKTSAPPREMAKKKPPSVRKAPSPVKAKDKPRMSEPEPKPEELPEQAAVAPPSEKNMSNGADMQQVQQTLKTRESEASLLRKYLAGLKQAIQDHLEYPQEARHTGNVGAPVIRFTITESGDILHGSLCVHKSSGSLLLDEKALLAARGAVPMAKPPRQMTVTITVAFTQDG